MALETWIVKLKTAISSSFENTKMRKSNVGVLAFEIAGLMSKILHLWQSLSDKNIIRLKNDSISLEGVRKIVSSDESFLLNLACAEMIENLRLIAKSISCISKRCEDSNFRSFDRVFEEFANAGRDIHNWVLSCKEMEAKNKKMDRYISLTSSLHKEMDELSTLENSLRKLVLCDHNKQKQKEQYSIKEQNKMIDLQQKILWQKQEVKYLKESSLWSRSFDTVVSLLSKSSFTVLARIKHVFGFNQGLYAASLPRSLSASAMVHPSDQNPPPLPCPFVSGPPKASSPDSEVIKHVMVVDNSKSGKEFSFFETNSKLLKPSATTLGSAALALHYANLIIVMDKMIKSPHLVGIDARDDLYAMLPSSIRSSLRARLKGIGFSGTDPVLAGEWRDALGRILGWLLPLAHNMIKWQSERSFEHQNLVPKTNVLLLQTLFFASKEKTEAAITELLVGLNYIWRFEREMEAKALFECTNLNNGLVKLENSS
ncbi:protein of unknown function DUF3475 [Dillenia turbinata]|uniref:DUF668 domain-containing protein n=1 Tax=Dillenia turbinata TaxID=194707 RepID=A0AAN8VBL2_9MAGN